MIGPPGRKICYTAVFWQIPYTSAIKIQVLRSNSKKSLELRLDVTLRHGLKIQIDPAQAHNGMVKWPSGARATVDSPNYLTLATQLATPVIVTRLLWVSANIQLPPKSRPPFVPVLSGF